MPIARETWSKVLNAQLLKSRVGVSFRGSLFPRGILFYLKFSVFFPWVFFQSSFYISEVVESHFNNIEQILNTIDENKGNQFALVLSSHKACSY